MRRLYFVNAPVDFSLIGGFSIAAYCLMRFVGVPDDATWIYKLSALLLWVGNWPHFSATSFRFYRSRENVKEFPLTAFVVPALLIAITVSCLHSPGALAPAFLKFYLIWSPYHFSGQSVGISLIYARRAGFEIARWQRWCLSSFIFGTFLYQTALAETDRAERLFYAIRFYGMGLPSWVPEVLKWLMIAGGVGFLGGVAFWCWKNKKMVPPIILLPAVTQFVWFVLGGRVRAFNEFVPFFHSVQYLMIAWAMQLKEKMDEESIAPSKRYVFGESLRWGVANVLGGIFLFWILPRFGEKMGYDLSFATPVIIAAVQIHHFFVDGVIWKLRNPRVHQPLLVNLRELVQPA